MMIKENQNQENITEESIVSAEPKQEVVEDVPSVIEVVEDKPVIENLEVEKPIEQIEISEPVVNEEVVKEKAEETASSLAETMNDEISPIQETKPEESIHNQEAGLPRSAELAETAIEEIPQVEIPPITPIQEVEQSQTIPTQEIKDSGSPRSAREDERVVEKIIYQTPPNLIQNLLNKARAKIQERKKIKLDKIMKLFELNSEISNSNIQNLLRTTKRSATRYLNILEKEQKITQVGNAGRSVKYVKKQ